MYREWANTCSKFDILDVAAKPTEYNQEKIKFHKAVEELERKLVTQFNLAFDECDTATKASMLIQILGTVMHIPMIFKEVKHRYNDVIEHFVRDLNLVKKTFDRGIENIEKGGLMDIPVDIGHPAVAGAVRWIHKLRSRLERHAAFFPYLDFP